LIERLVRSRLDNVQEFAEQLQRVDELLLALRLNLTVLTTEERSTWTAITQKIESMKRPSNDEELLAGAAILKEIGDMLLRIIANHES